MKILIIEDEKELAKDIADYLSSVGYLCEFAATFSLAIEKIEMYNYDCILLDLMLPGGSGLSILEKLKASKKQDGIIIVSAKNSIEDKVKGLQIGADDYLEKPFNHAELAARIFSVIRRKQFNNANFFEQGNIKINLNAKNVTVNDSILNLTKKEYDLLLFFMGNKNKVISKNALAEHLSGDIADMFDNFDFVYAHVKNLKKKLNEVGCSNIIKTVYGTGYKWDM